MLIKFRTKEEKEKKIKPKSVKLNWEKAIEYGFIKKNDIYK